MPLLYQQCTQGTNKKGCTRVRVGALNTDSIRDADPDPLTTPAAQSRKCKYAYANGRGCGNFAAETLLCWQHLQKENGVRIKATRHGRGLFATKDFQPGDWIGGMGGRPERPLGAPLNNYNRDWARELPNPLDEPYSYPSETYVVEISMQLKRSFAPKAPWETVAIPHQMHAHEFEGWQRHGAVQRGVTTWVTMLSPIRRLRAKTVKALIDASQERGPGSYANDPNVIRRGLKGYREDAGNAEIQALGLEYPFSGMFGEAGMLVATKPIRAGQEITVAYGRAYWGDGTPTSASRTYRVARRAHQSAKPSTRCTIKC